jgi:tetratricopeptide (TPR) repeat protein
MPEEPESSTDNALNRAADSSDRRRRDKLFRVLSDKIARNPESADLHAQMGTVCLDLGDNRRALNHLLTALELDPNRDYLIERIKHRLPDEEWRHVVFPEKRRQFWRDPGHFVLYPLAREGVLVMISGAVLFTFMTMVPFTGFLLILLLAFPLIGAFMMNIVRHSADGERDMPGWPEIDDLFDSIARPSFQLLFATLTAFSPAGLLYLFGSRLPAFPAGSGFLLITLLILGTVYAPAAVMAAALFNSARAALNLPLLIKSIFIMRKDYALAWIILIGIFLVWGLSGAIFPGTIPILGSLLQWILIMYFVTLQMYILGNLYYVHERELDWF